MLTIDHVLMQPLAISILIQAYVVKSTALPDRVMSTQVLPWTNNIVYLGLPRCGIPMITEYSFLAPKSHIHKTIFQILPSFIQSQTSAPHRGDTNL